MSDRSADREQPESTPERGIPVSEPEHEHGVVEAPQAGPGRFFVLLYGVFAVGTTSRAAVELLRNAAEAPIAYGLSAVAAAIYLIGFVLLLRWGHPGSRAAMRVLCWTELTGVVVVGTLSLLVPEWFPQASVWSYYGAGYLLLPAILPILVLRWLSTSSSIPSSPRR